MASAYEPGGGDRYVLITAAHDEEAAIGETLRSVLAQSHLPARWVIASDNSVDRTDELVREQAARHERLKFVRIDRTGGHEFGSKVRALQAAERELAGVDYDYIGVLDADVRLPQDYFRDLIDRFDEEPDLGIAGGNIVQIVDGARIPRLKDPRTVAGSVQLFRRRCFEETGGFLPLRYGGEDAVIEWMARMKGWSVRTILELEVEHFGLVGAGSGSPLRARRRWGRMNRSIGYHPLYQLARTVRRAAEKPLLVGALHELWGYVAEALRPGGDRVPGEVRRFIRREQLRKLAGRR